MAIGVRITSNNLSGLTANVTFLPISGGTIDLGEQTIPFNYINPNPYGTFQVYVPLYDYTYDITINQPIDVKSFVFSSKLINNNNHGFINLNYGDLTATVYDLDVDYTLWYLNDIYPITDSGYGFYFGNNYTCDLQWVIFTDSIGNIIDSFQTNCGCSNYSYDMLGGKFAVFADYFNSILKIFDGKEVFTLTADSANELVDYTYDWDGVTSNDSMIVRYESKTGTTFNLKIFKDGSLTSFGETYDYTTDGVNAKTYFDGSFIYVTKYDNLNSKFSYIKIYDGLSGELLQDIDISSYNFNTDYFSFYGNNKCVQILWNEGDPNIDYFIYQYNGNTDTLNSVSHNRLNYQNKNIFCQQNLNPNNGGSDSFGIILKDTPSSNNFGQIVSYCDILYMLSGDTSIQTLVFQNSGIPDKTIWYNLTTNNNIFVPCDNGDGNASVLSISNTGITYHNTNLLMINNPGVNEINSCGNGFVSTFYEDTNYDKFTLIHINENGVLGDLINNITLPGPWQRSSESFGNIYQFRPYTGDTYYITPSSDSFQIGTNTGSTFNSYYPVDTFTPNFIRTGNILYYNYDNFECYMLTPTGVTSTFTLPENDGNYGISISDNYFTYVYIDNISGLTHINLYDFNFNLVNSLDTEFTSWWGSDSCKDNFAVIINENSKYYVYLVTNSQITYKELSDNNLYYTYNDYVWWY